MGTETVCEVCGRGRARDAAHYLSAQVCGRGVIGGDLPVSACYESGYARERARAEVAERDRDAAKKRSQEYAQKSDASRHRAIAAEERTLEALKGEVAAVAEANTARAALAEAQEALRQSAVAVHDLAEHPTTAEFTDCPHPGCHRNAAALGVGR